MKPPFVSLNPMGFQKQNVDIKSDKIPLYRPLIKAIPARDPKQWGTGSRTRAILVVKPWCSFKAVSGREHTRLILQVPFVKISVEDRAQDPLHRFSVQPSVQDPFVSENGHSSKNEHGVLVKRHLRKKGLQDHVSCETSFENGDEGTFVL